MLIFDDEAKLVRKTSRNNNSSSSNDDDNSSSSNDDNSNNNNNRSQANETMPKKWVAFIFAKIKRKKILTTLSRSKKLPSFFHKLAIFWQTQIF